MGIPFLSSFIDGLKLLFKSKRMIWFTTIFFLGIIFSSYIGYMIPISTGVIGDILKGAFLYIGSTTTIYFIFATVGTVVGKDKWFYRRRDLKNTVTLTAVWLIASFWISILFAVYLDIIMLFIFVIACWIGWIGFQSYMSSRTALRIATLSEPTKTGVITKFFGFFVMLLSYATYGGLGYFMFIMNGTAPRLIENFSLIVTGFIFLGFFLLLNTFLFFRYISRGTSLNVALMSFFVLIYTGYFSYGILFKSSPKATAVDFVISIVFLLYSLSGIGKTISSFLEDEKPKGIQPEAGLFFVFFLASGYFFVDSIIALPQIQALATSNVFGILFKDVIKFVLFPMIATIVSIYYVKVQRVKRLIEKSKETGEQVELTEEEQEVAEKIIAEEKAKTPYTGPPRYKPSGRLHVDDSRRLGPAKRYKPGEDEE